MGYAGKVKMTRGKPRAWRIAAWVALCLLAGVVLNVAVAWGLVWLPPLPMGWMTSWDRVPTAPVDSIALPPHLPTLNKFFSRSSAGQTQWQMIWDEPAADGTEAAKPARTIVANLSHSGLPMLSMQYQEIVDVRNPGQIISLISPGSLASWRGGIDLGPNRFGLFPVWPGFAVNTLIFATTIAWVWRGVLTFRAARRVRGGLCASCGYDRRGLATGTPCPECGGLPAVDVAHPQRTGGPPAAQS